VLLALLVAAALASLLIHVGSFAVVGRLLRVPIDEVSLFIGPAVVSRKVSGFKLKVGAIPLGGYVRFAREFYEKAALWKQLIITFSGCFSLLVIACLCLGPATAVAMVGNLFLVIAESVVPTSEARALSIASSSAFLEQATMAELFGAVAATLCTINLLPLTSLNGGHALLHIARAIRPIGEKAEGVLSIASALMAFYLTVLWVVSLVVYLF